jgi:hypothetical protein
MTTTLGRYLSINQSSICSNGGVQVHIDGCMGDRWEAVDTYVRLGINEEARTKKKRKKRKEKGSTRSEISIAQALTMHTSIQPV